MEEKEDNCTLALGTRDRLMVIDGLGPGILHPRETDSLVNVEKNMIVGNRT